MHLGLRSINSGRPSRASGCGYVLHVCPLLGVKRRSSGSLAQTVGRGPGPRSGAEQSPGLSSLRTRSDPGRDAPLRTSQPAGRSQRGALALPANSHLCQPPFFYLHLFSCNLMGESMSSSTYVSLETVNTGANSIMASVK